MSESPLEERVSKLEQLVNKLIHGTDAAPKDWRQTVGMFDGDPIMKEIIEEGRRIREADRRQTQV
ncbi:hypothetical protein [Candidatus Entotheonella palauensis]|uniref:Uncharacterized protein n=1 Tax=Candidatus Entotheonella gemina TaxID=1429439 RepID=W4LWF3_9BACT|nr:hypothetical protein [Candidatus Entotheonella palauensis]ETX02230.1 MAG: hypothetical protein ETSY2_35970 [Candidatus Entotheonella gemina]